MVFWENLSLYSIKLFLEVYRSLYFLVIVLCVMIIGIFLVGLYIVCIMGLFVENILLNLYIDIENWINIK